ncbi:MAG: VTT domain-containing protein [bacterium]|nr:VTT domain-containing protein [bacterium]
MLGYEMLTTMAIGNFDVNSWIASGGILLIAAIVFAESGLLIGFFLPGDTLLLAAGVLAAQGVLNLPILLIAVYAAAVLGDNVGYSIGRRSGSRIFKKKEGILFHPEQIDRANRFYNKHGGKTIIMARFVPVVRTFAPIVAGVGKMDRQKFFLYNLVGAGLWGIGVTMIGFWFGELIPDVDKYIVVAFLLASVATIGPALYHLFKEKRNRELMMKRIKDLISKLSLNKRID